MSIKLLLRRGLETDLPTLAAGEPGFCTDSYKLFIGSAAGNKGIAMLASPTFTGLVTLSDTLSATVGPIRNARRFLIHDFQHPTGGGAIPTGNNIFIGGAGNFTMGSTATNVGHASANIGIGASSLAVNTIGYDNIAVGVGALFKNTTGQTNIAVGSYSLFNNTIGNGNTAIGETALFSNTIGGTCVAVGHSALYNNVVAGCQVAVGGNALYNSAPADPGDNTAVGSDSLYTNVSGQSNVAVGVYAGYYETGSNKLFIDNAMRASEADGRIKALIYGVFDALTANQRLSFNSRVLIRECPNYANNAAAVAGGLASGELYTVTGTDPLQVAKVV